MRFAMDVLMAMYILLMCKAGYVKADCSHPEVACSHCIIEPASSSESTYPVGTYLDWKCEDNYVMNGPSDVIVWVCGRDDQWTGEQPNCTVLACPHPPIPAYGGVSPVTSEHYSPGYTITYSCQDGYQLNGSATNTCEMDGSWANEGPTCGISETWCSPQRLDVMTSPHSCIIARQLLVTDTMKWKNAKTTCQNLGGTVPAELAMIKTQTMQNDMRDLIDIPKLYDYYFDTYFWIGLKEGRSWKWSRDESNIQRLFWAEDQPSSISGSGCIALSRSDDYLWVEASCDSARRFICQYDGSCTGRSLGDAVLQLAHRHKCYRFSIADATWSEASDTCTAEGGSLVEVMDESLQDYLTQQASHLEDNLANWWIGGYDDVTETERAWFWVDNTRATFMSWSDGQPNNPSKKCVEVNSDLSHNWNDKGCNTKRQAMCQIGIAACGDPGAPAHGNRSPGDRSTFLDGAVVQFYCDPGYEMEGASEITCQPNGSWSGVKPSCAVLSCGGTAPEVNNAVVIFLSRTFRGTAVYACNEGSFPSGNPVSFCKANATWSQPDFECTEVPSTRPTSRHTTTVTTTQSTEASTTTRTTSTVPLTPTLETTLSTSSSSQVSTEPYISTTTSPPPANTTKDLNEGKTGQGNITDTANTITNEGTGWENTSVPLTIERVRTSDIMIPVGAIFAIIVSAIVIVICIVVWRRRRLRKSRNSSTLDVPNYDCIGNVYRISFKRNTRGAAENNNDAYIGLDLSGIQSVATDTQESRYMTVGQGIIGRRSTGTGSSGPRGRSGTVSSTTPLATVDDEGYDSLRISEVRSTQQLPSTSLSRFGNVPQGDMGTREGVEFDQFRSAFRAYHRGSVDTNSNQYETLDTPRPSIDMGVLRKQGSLGENDYEELDDMDISCDSGGDKSNSQNATTANKSGSSPLPTRPPLPLHKRETTYSKVDDPGMIFNDLYFSSRSDVINGHAIDRSDESSFERNSASDSHMLDDIDEKRTTIYDKVDDATLIFNDLYVPSGTVKDMMNSQEAIGNLTRIETAAVLCRDTGRIHDVRDDVCEPKTHVRGDTQGQVSDKSERSASPKTNLQNRGRQEEASSNPTIDRPKSHYPYYFCLNPSADSTDIDVSKGIANEEAYQQNISIENCDKENEENDREQFERTDEDSEGPPLYYTLEPPF